MNIHPPTRLRTPELRVLPLGSIKPAGWLLHRMLLQADGMAGWLDEVWPDVGDSSWIGGNAEGWERGPYWLDGVTGLAFALDDARLLAKVNHWVDYILDHQAADGWLGPETGDPSPKHAAEYGDRDVWPRMIISKALLHYHEATGDDRILPALLRPMTAVRRVLRIQPLHEWGRSRWGDLVQVVHHLYDLTGEEWLLDLAELARQQGLDWDEIARDFPYPDRVDKATLKHYQRDANGFWHNDDFLATHGVNVAMALKSFPAWWRQSGDDTQRKLYGSLLASVDQHHGQANGLFSCDEHFGTQHPSQGAETCTVVELLTSLAEALRTWPMDEQSAELWELLAFNALPASALPDESAHQYVQQPNQVVCHVTEDRIYTNNGPSANTFGLAPNFGCCTANRHQGWPRFLSRLWLRRDDELCAVSYVPCTVSSDVGDAAVTVEVRGAYPFANTIDIEVQCDRAAEFSLALRIPGWASEATVSVDGRTRQVQPGTVHRLRRTWAGRSTVTLALVTPVRIVDRPHGAVAIRRGALLYALEIGQRLHQYDEQYGKPSWEIHPTTPWNYALVLDPADPASSLTFHPLAGNLNADPFHPDRPPTHLTARGRRVSWELDRGAAAAPPPSPVATDAPAEPVRLIPYGCTNLRVTELPWTT